MNTNIFEMEVITIAQKVEEFNNYLFIEKWNKIKVGMNDW